MKLYKTCIQSLEGKCGDDYDKEFNFFTMELDHADDQRVVDTADVKDPSTSTV